jgi:hypothetical protein
MVNTNLCDASQLPQWLQERNPTPAHIVRAMRHRRVNRQQQQQ